MLYERTVDYTDTMYEGIYRIPPGHFMTIKDDKVHMERYWYPEKIKVDYRISEEEAAEKLKELFAKAVVLNGGDKVAAYKKAGYSMSMTSGAISVEADKIYNHPKVSLRIKELQGKSIEKFIKTKEDKLKILEDVMFKCAKGDDEKGMVNPASVIAAIKEQNAMQGDNAPTETSNTHTIVKADDTVW